jgi:hypothetical protein
MKAELIYNEKISEGAYIQELVAWLLAKPVTGCRHLFKYRLYFGTNDGTCLVRYDNERGRGDHKHVTGIEYTYGFSTLQTVFTDFNADIDAVLLNKEQQL